MELSTTWVIIACVAAAAAVSIWYILNAPDIWDEAGVSMGQKPEEDRRDPTQNEFSRMLDEESKDACFRRQADVLGVE